MVSSFVKVADVVRRLINQLDPKDDLVLDQVATPCLPFAAVTFTTLIFPHVTYDELSLVPLAQDAASLRNSQATDRAVLPLALSMNATREMVFALRVVQPAERAAPTNTRAFGPTIQYVRIVRDIRSSINPA